MKKLLLIALCVTGASVYAADPATIAALGTLAGEILPENLEVGVTIDVATYIQKLDQLQKLNLGDDNIATIIQEGSQNAAKLAQAIDNGQITNAEQLPGWALSVGVSVTKVKQIQNNVQDIKTGKGTKLTAKQTGSQTASHR